MAKVKIITLSDNTVFGPQPPVLGEHGLSIYLEYDGRRILFDTGSGRTVLHNAEQLGIDLRALDSIVISHGHGDHIGGLPKLLSAVGPKDVYIHPEAFIEKAVLRGRQFHVKRIHTEALLVGAGANIIRRRESREIAPGLWLVGPIPRSMPCDDPKMAFRYRRLGGSYVPDSFSDEQALAINSPMGLILILGCTHNGLENTVNEALRVTGAKKLHTVIGGLHLAGVGCQRLGRIADFLIKLGIRNLLSCHCTGQQEVAVLYQLLGDCCHFNRVGNSIEIDW